jgi:hypothetical protein
MLLSLLAMQNAQLYLMANGVCSAATWEAWRHNVLLPIQENTGRLGLELRRRYPASVP